MDQHREPRHVREWIVHLQTKALAPRTIRNLYSLLRSTFADAYGDDLIDSSPCRLRGGDLPKSDDKNPRWRVSAIFTREEVASLISDDRIPIDRRTLYATAFLTASRSGELSALRTGDYDPAMTPLARLTIGES
jgi:integrase